MVGGACVAPWHTTAVEWVIYGATVFGVLALVIVPALVAPRLERTVAGAGALLAIGSTAALYVITAWSVMVPLVVIAAAAAALGLACIWPRRTAHAAT